MVWYSMVRYHTSLCDVIFWRKFHVDVAIQIYHVNNSVACEMLYHQLWYQYGITRSSKLTNKRHASITLALKQIETVVNY